VLPKLSVPTPETPGASVPFKSTAPPTVPVPPSVPAAATGTADPAAVAPVIARNPAFTFVLPVYVFVPPNTHVPVPAFVIVIDSPAVDATPIAEGTVFNPIFVPPSVITAVVVEFAGLMVAPPNESVDAAPAALFVTASVPLIVRLLLITCGFATVDVICTVFPFESRMVPPVIVYAAAFAVSNVMLPITSVPATVTVVELLALLNVAVSLSLVPEMAPGNVATPVLQFVSVAPASQFPSVGLSDQVALAPNDRPANSPTTPIASAAATTFLT